MSYLTGPRLHFAGSFQADVSTVNNDVRHFDATTWEERFQSRQDDQGDNGWWNPTGSGAYRLLNCTVTGSAGSRAATDPVLNARILNAEDRAAAKLVDLDPQWQMASSIWGMTVRIVTPDGEELLRGAFEQAPFRDINFGRQLPNTPDVRRIQNGSAVFQSVLTDVVWGAGARTSPLLELLRTTTADGQLSIRLTTFGYYTDSTHDRFTLGSVVGAIGIYRADAPRSFTLGRRFVPVPNTAGPTGFFDGALINNGEAIALDLSNALPLVDTRGSLMDLGPIALSVAVQDGASTVRRQIGIIDYTSPDWLTKESGIAVIPVPPSLRAACATSPLMLVATAGAGVILARESNGGVHVRADNFVARLDPGSNDAAYPSRIGVRLYASRLGAPFAGAEISISDPGPLEGLGGAGRRDPNPPRAAIPTANIPTTGLRHATSVTCDARGTGTLKVQAGSPENARGYIDGQIYIRNYSLVGHAEGDQHDFDMLIFHVRDVVHAPAQPTWHDIGPILSQFGNLYPVMSRRLINLSDPSDVRANAQVMKFVLTLPLEDPNHMPVTRDLSLGKRNLIVTWLDNPVMEPTELEFGLKSQPLPLDRRSRPSAALPETAAEPAPHRHEIAGKNAFAAQIERAFGRSPDKGDK